MIPTPEQEAALEVFRTGSSMAIEALAGTGKTTTLKMLATTTRRRGQYVAFNKSIVGEAQKSFPRHVNCSTAHSLAFRALGHRYQHRLGGGRMRSSEIAQRLRIDPIYIRSEIPKVLQPGYLGGLVMRSVEKFCQSADSEPEARHVPYVEGIDLRNADGVRTYDNNREVAARLVPYMLGAWKDIQDLQGDLPFRHAFYLKLWELRNPKIVADFLLVDEAQDMDPVMISIVEQQRDAQVVWVGDPNQAIYEWRGAVDALSRVQEGGLATSTLTRSFRFGPDIAEVANQVLEMLGCELRVIGHDVDSRVGYVADPDAILTRTNAEAVSVTLRLQEQGSRPHLIGGGMEVLGFAKAALDLQAVGVTWYPDLACFNSWGEVQLYASEDALGGELKLMVDLVDEFTATAIIGALEHMPSEASADIVLSTAHKAKGREWGRVQLAGDFPSEPGREEQRLLYVAATRARRELDVESTILAREPHTIDDSLAAAEDGSAVVDSIVEAR